ncbi:MAG: sensor histidine kinase, partial [Nitrososphaerales archaeon]
ITRVAKQMSRHATSDRQRDSINQSTREIQNTVIEFETQIIDKLRMYYGLSSLGISVAAVAHEIGESIGAILQRIKRALEIMEERPLSYDESKKSLERNLKDILKIREFMSFAAVFTSSQERQKSNVELPDMIETVLEAYESIFRDQYIDVELDIDYNVPAVQGFKVEFESIMINLFTNSIEALKEIQTGRKIKITCKGDSREITIRFSDSANGIPIENREIIFEPFFTSKEEGTGLGLPIIKEILNNYGGAISVIDSELGNGATFLILIPVGVNNK